MSVYGGASRYQNCEIATTTVRDPAGGERRVRYLRRRFPSEAAGQRPLAVHRIGAGERLDLVTHRYLGDALAFWQLADANAALDPDDLLAPWAEGSVLIIPTPGM
ncbi:hypothetical protein [Streptomyces sp. Caat 7-52]|uniref:hypothetical protein n=1 Tax=Streptomyces sp. Caat 7-52 TaxID=2949637 RepID=UPI002035453D|nr:hypothetical protein [Streptomyces sp. Caat 7-52]